MADRTCERCGKVFALPCRLRDHLDRKIPCSRGITADEASVVVPAAAVTLAADETWLGCKLCGKTYTSTSNLYRHQRRNCKASTPHRASATATTANVTNYIDNSFNINLTQLDAIHTISVNADNSNAGFQQQVPLEWLRHIATAQNNNENTASSAAETLANLIRKCRNVPVDQNFYTSLEQTKGAIVYIGDDVWQTFAIHSAIRIMLARMVSGDAGVRMQ